MYIKVFNFCQMSSEYLTENCEGTTPLTSRRVLGSSYCEANKWYSGILVITRIPEWECIMLPSGMAMVAMDNEKGQLRPAL